MNKIAILALVGAFGVSTSAMAADLGIISQPAPEAFVQSGAFDWTGFYVGVNGGYGWAEAEALGVSFDDIEGGFGGVQAGYNYDFGGFVLGAEADVQFSGVEGDIPAVGSASLDNFGTVRARAGVALDRFLPYVTAGLAWGNATIDTSAGDLDDNYVGWTIGAGLEYAVTDNVTVKAEYLYTDYGSADFGTPLDFDLTSNVVRAGINFKF